MKQPKDYLKNMGIMIPRDQEKWPDGSPVIYGQPAPKRIFYMEEQSHRPRRFEFSGLEIHVPDLILVDTSSLDFDIKINFMQERHLNELTTTAEMGKYGKNIDKFEAMSRRIAHDMGEPVPEGFKTPSAADLIAMRDHAKHLKSLHFSKRQIRKDIINRFHVVMGGSWREILNPQKNGK